MSEGRKTKEDRQTDTPKALLQLVALISFWLGYFVPPFTLTWLRGGGQDHPIFSLIITSDYAALVQYVTFNNSVSNPSFFTKHEQAQEQPGSQNMNIVPFWIRLNVHKHNKKRGNKGRAWEEHVKSKSIWWSSNASISTNYCGNVLLLLICLICLYHSSSGRFHKQYYPSCKNS